MDLKQRLAEEVREELSFPGKWMMGRVQRCHAQPGRIQHSVAGHTFGVLLLLDQFHPDPPAALFRAALHHDLAEGLVGDLPAQVKWINPKLAEEHELIEEELLEHHFGNWRMALSPADCTWLAWADRIEFFMRMCYELLQGNGLAFHPFERIHMLLMEQWPAIPTPLQDACRQILLLAQTGATNRQLVGLVTFPSKFL